MIECLLSQCVVSAPLRGGKQPCGRAAGGGADRPRANRGPGDAHGRRIPWQPPANSSVEPCAGPKGRRPGTPTSADPLFGGGVLFPGCAQACLCRALLAIKPSGHGTSTPTGVSEAPACSCGAGQGAPAVRCVPADTAVPTRRARGAPARCSARAAAQHFCVSAPKAGAGTCARRRRLGGVRSMHALRLSAPSAQPAPKHAPSL